MSRRRRRLIAGLLCVAALLLALILLLALQLQPERLKVRIERAVLESTGLVLHIDGELQWSTWPLPRVSLGTARLLTPDPAAAPLVQWHALAVAASWRALLRGDIRIESLRSNGLEISLRRGADGAIAWPSLVPARAGSQGTRGVTLERVEIDDATLRLDDVRLEGLQLRAALAFEPATHVLRVRDASLRGRLHGGPLPPAGVSVALASPLLTLRQEPLRLEAAGVHAALAGLEAELRLDGVADLAAPVAAGAVHLTAPSLRAFAQALGVELPPTRDAQAFGAIDVESGWRVGAATLSLEPLRVRMDGNEFTGTVNAPSAGPAPGQPLRFALAGERLDLDRYLRPQDQPGEPFALPVAWLRTLHVEGDLRLKEARLTGATARGVRLRVIDSVESAREAKP